MILLKIAFSTVKLSRKCHQQYDLYLYQKYLQFWIASYFLHTKKSNISRLENVNSKISPKLSTIEEYARAVGYKLEINFIPQS